MSWKKNKKTKNVSFSLALACHWFNWLASCGDGCMQSVNTKSKSPNPIQPFNAFAFFRLFLRSRREQINFLLAMLFLTPRARNWGLVGSPRRRKRSEPFASSKQKTTVGPFNLVTRGVYARCKRESLFHIYVCVYSSPLQVFTRSWGHLYCAVYDARRK